MPNKTPSYKDKVLKEFDEEFDGSLWSDPDSLAIPKYREVNNFIIKALDEQMKLVMECLPERHQASLYLVEHRIANSFIDQIKENLKSKGLL